jgi:hypothetical protein
MNNKVCCSLYKREKIISTLTRSLRSPPSPITKGEGDKKEASSASKREREKNVIFPKAGEGR